ncbi:hypothetical protein PHIN109289_19425 [Phaeobacter inhibens]|uniref:hypothetical protein n=1 Tax=Phaeobacter inhibens TaxID=221822 RepID=UPI0004193516|nr:hypothetical protein [Phaeobacter inhibens]
MRRVVGHDGALSSPLLSLGSAGQAGGGGSIGAATGLFRRQLSLSGIVGSPSLSILKGICVVPDATGGGKLIVSSEDTGGALIVYDIRNWEDLSDPANSVVSHGQVSPGNRMMVAAADGSHFAFFGSASPISVYRLTTPWDVNTMVLDWSVGNPISHASKYACFARDGGYLLRFRQETGSPDYISYLDKWNAASPWVFSGIDTATPDQSVLVPSEIKNNGGAGIFMPADDELCCFNSSDVGLGYGVQTLRFGTNGDLDTLTYQGQRPDPHNSSSEQFAYAPDRTLWLVENRGYLTEQY